MGKSFHKCNESGFTLIEIIAVLVIIGVLAAAAVPKFIDLQARAREQAAFNAAAELKMRVNQYFNSELLAARTWSQMNWLAADVGTNLGDDFSVTSWSISNNKSTGTITVNLRYESPYSPTEYTKVIDMPRYTN